jgi:hypothetical protein
MRINNVENRSQQLLRITRNNYCERFSTTIENDLQQLLQLILNSNRSLLQLILNSRKELLQLILINNNGVRHHVEMLRNPESFHQGVHKRLVWCRIWTSERNTARHTHHTPHQQHGSQDYSQVFN